MAFYKGKIGKCGKVVFTTEAAAESRIAWLKLAKPFFYTGAMRVYPCRICKAFHITSQEKKPCDKTILL